MKKLLLFAFILSAVPAFATSLYVSTTGSDGGSNNCQTIGSPCATIQHGINVMVKGDVLNLCGGACDGSGAGSFDESSILIDAKVGTGFDTANAYTIQSYSGETITVKELTECSGCQGFYFNGSSAYVIFDGSWGGTATVPKLIFDCTNISGSCVRSNAADGNPINNIRLNYVEVENAGRWTGNFNRCTSPCNANGLLIGGAGWDILHCLIHDNGEGQLDHGIYGCDHCTVMHSQIYRNSGNGIQKYGTVGPGGDHATFAYNIFRDNGQSGWVGGPGAGFGLTLYNSAASPGATVYNNIIYHNFDGGINMVSEDDDVIVNNTIYNNSGYAGIRNMGSEGTVRTVIKNNIVYNNSTNIFDNAADSVVSNNLCNATGGDCNLSGNPLFTDANANDFTLQQTSPAVDAGTDLSATLTDDYAGTSRPQDGDGNGTSTFDIGAYEYENTQAPPPPAIYEGTPSKKARVKGHRIH